MPKGVVILVTGDGKGKTTSALGQVFRALGHGWKVCFLQFIKGERPTGEKRLARRLGKQLFFKPLGKGFTWEGELAGHIEAGLEAWQFAKERVMSDQYDLVVLDELTFLVRYKIIPEREVLELIKERPQRLNLLITGRRAAKSLVDACDIVSEIRAVKYPQDQPARKGIEY
ncbi:MAG TPA: cob(I)yrinic acid a,c-diamide adenosyltransferase [archaeon]|nr:cob(I)yrinic acid a,c-diamide adenosyltransferase [archaeon]